MPTSDDPKNLMQAKIGLSVEYDQARGGFVLRSTFAVKGVQPREWRAEDETEVFVTTLGAVMRELVVEVELIRAFWGEPSPLGDDGVRELLRLVGRDDV